jgi:hypothetical protein
MVTWVTRKVFPLDFGAHLCESDGVPSDRPRLAPLLLLIALSVALGVLTPGRADAADVTYEVVESWSVTLTYQDWGGGEAEGEGFTGTRTFSGREVGRVTARSGSYLLVNRVGHHLAGVDPALTKRAIIETGGQFSISGSNVFAPAFGATTHAIVFLGAFMLSVPLVDGDVPSFNAFESYAGEGDAGGIVGGGSMSGDSLSVSVQSTLTLTPLIGPTPSADGPFGLVAGNYSGVFAEGSAMVPVSSGLLTARVDARGAFSARLATLAGNAGVSGRFDSNGWFAKELRLGTNLLGLTLELPPGSPGPLMARITSTAGTWAVDAQRAAFDARLRPAIEQANRYTLRVLGNPAYGQPNGDGVAAVQISISGQTSVKGSLADGTPFVCHGALAEDGRWPVYQKLSGRSGFILGWLQAGGQSSSAIIGVLQWSRQPLAKARMYPDGIDFITTAEGSVWHFFDGAVLFENSPVTFGFSGGDLTSPLSRSVMFSERRNPVSAEEKFQFKLSPFTGLFTGSFELAGLGMKIRFKGAMLPQQGYGAGYVLGPGHSGVLQLQW